MMSKNILDIEEGSPLDYEELVVYIVARERPLAESSDMAYDSIDIVLLHKEEGPEKVKIKFLECIQEQEYSFDDFIQALEKAKALLLS